MCWGEPVVCMLYLKCFPYSHLFCYLLCLVLLGCCDTSTPKPNLSRATRNIVQRPRGVWVPEYQYKRWRGFLSNWCMACYGMLQSMKSLHRITKYCNRNCGIFWWLKFKLSKCSSCFSQIFWGNKYISGLVMLAVNVLNECHACGHATWNCSRQWL